MNHDDIRHQIPDYALGHLSPNLLYIVEQHVAHCSTCQQAMIRERKMAQLVRSSVEAAAQAEPVDIRKLMPAIPHRRESHLSPWGQQRWLAPAVLILVLFFGGLFLNNLLPSGSVPGFVATAYAATATSTHTPTATLVQAAPQRQQTNDFPVINNRLRQVIEPIPAARVDRLSEPPGLMPTPVAAIRAGLN